ncbi:hypothetical protein EVAR_74418_1 [Eumeta japonica]|uniref:Uncharacterized protein n=1 Tax=Eumeta variegata TaxID=151549 RepID=A0A4C1SG37_EUMVA|nr:hypothetical protein EVAR_74418_1 [Eumeta japonica]
MFLTSGIVRRYAPGPFFLRLVPILRHCDAFVTYTNCECKVRTERSRIWRLERLLRSPYGRAGPGARGEWNTCGKSETNLITPSGISISLTTSVICT